MVQIIKEVFYTICPFAMPGMEPCNAKDTQRNREIGRHNIEVLSPHAFRLLAVWGVMFYILYPLRDTCDAWVSAHSVSGSFNYFLIASAALAAVHCWSFLLALASFVILLNPWLKKHGKKELLT